MKKNYYMVLVALFSFALNAFSQEDKWETVTSPDATEAQGNAYNMVITLPDGTTFTVNTDDVDEVLFSNGQISVSGTSIQQLLTALTALQAEEDATLANVEWLHSRCTQLENSIQANFTNVLGRLVELEKNFSLIDQKVQQALNLGQRITALEANFSILGIDVQAALRTAHDAYSKAQSNEAVLNALMSKDAVQDAEINNQKDLNAALNAIISDLLDRVQKLESK